MTEPSRAILDVALGYIKAGFSIIPVQTDGTKSPIGSWKKYQSQSMTQEECAAKFALGVVGVGIVAGPASVDGLEVFDFDHPEAFEAFRALVEELQPGLVDQYPLIETPNDGHHLYIRTRSFGKNRKFA